MKLTACLTLATLLASSAFVACASPRAPTTAAPSITAAEVSASSLAAAPAFDGAEPAEAMPGKLECRTKSGTEGTSELFLEWNGKSAKGILRRVAPSGMVYVQPVTAERSGALVVADATCGETDLVAHSATIAQANGKNHMKLGDGRMWLACE